MNNPAGKTYCNRLFTPSDIDVIRGIIRNNPAASRYRLSQLVCTQLQWFRTDGRLKDMSCRVAMLRMQRDGVIGLPPPGRGPAKARPRQSFLCPPGPPVETPAVALGPLDLRLARTTSDSRLWNEAIDRYHYLGYCPVPGDQARYLVSAGGTLLAALGFSAAAWTVAPRDAFIGWTNAQRVQRLRFAANNSRFLILPWVRSKNLASRILAAAARSLPDDWRTLYGYSPVLLETFVDSEKFRGTCYRAAGWIHVGCTKGRGKLEKRVIQAVPIKDIYLYPLRRDFRSVLCAGG